MATSHEPAACPGPLAALLLRPASLAALIALGLNDHVLKGAGLVPAWLTGKLSDFAGLYLFPLLLAALADTAARVARRTPHRRALAWLASGATAASFAAVKLWPAANAALARVIGPMALDVSDLLALPMTLLAARTMITLERAPAGPAAQSFRARVGRLVTMCVACLVCGATSREAPNYPSWRTLGPDEQQSGCARVEAWVSKSGKEGFGVTVDLRSADVDGPCAVEITQASFRDAGGTITNAPLPPPLEAPNDVRAHVYLPFAFDNQSVWNRSLEDPAWRRGVLLLGIRAGGRPPQTLLILLEQPELGPYGHWPSARHPPQSRPFGARGQAGPAAQGSGTRGDSLPRNAVPQRGGTCWPD